MSPAPHRFGAIEVRPVERQLLIGGATVSIGARAFDVLLALIERRDRVVTKNELLDLVWPGLVVEENNLQVQISSLRKLLGPNVIATIPGRGYRLTLRESAVHTPPPAQIALPHHLPAERTRFIGRAAELQMCETLLRDTRLLTITGIGGGGKTRFAVELAKRQCGAYADGVWFVDLAPLQDGSRVVLAAAAPFGVQERPGVPLIERLAQRLAAWHALIVLDNCEHVLAAAAELIDTLLDACAALTFVATSREALGLAGEQCFALPPLSLPAEQPANDPRDSEAVRLFIDRAQLLRPDFAPTRADANVVGDICGRLDGIPLAIELAAGRIKVLSAEQIRARLDDRFRLLTAGQRNVPRHQTLQAAIQWSYDLLAADERQLLDTLSVFAGGWTLDAAVAVAGSEGNEAEILDRLTRLIDKSLVVVERTAGGGLRYHLLETVRQFAQQRLDAGGDADAVHSRHLDYFVPLALKQSESLTPAPAQLVWFDAELENLLAAHAWCSRVASAVERGLWLVGGLWNYWNPRGVLALGYRVTLEALERPGAQARTAARCLALTAAGYIGVHCGRAEQAQAHLQEGLGIAREINDKNRIAMALVRLALAEQTLGNRPAAGAHLEESLALARAAGIPHRIASALTSLGEWHRAVGEFDAAEPLYEEDLALAADNRPEGKLAPLLNLAMISIARSDADKARRRLQEILEVLERLPSRYAEIVTLEVCAALAAFLGQWERAEGFFAATEAQRERIGDHREPADDAFIAPWIERTRSALGGATSGAPITLEDALAQARVWIAGMNR